MNDPQHNVQQLGLTPGMHVADIGAGTGYYSMAAADLVGKNGQVFAIDIQKDLLESIQNTAKEKGFMNVKTVWGNAEKERGTRLRDESVDAVIVANTLFQIDDHSGLATETARICRPDGELLVVEWNGSHGGLGPAPDNVIPQEKTREMFELAGFEHDRDLDAGEHHYGMVMSRKT